MFSESALDDLDLNDFGVSALERSLESSSAMSSVGVMLGIVKFFFLKILEELNEIEMHVHCFAEYTHDEITAYCLLVFIGGSQFQSSAPVNIPGSFSTSAPFSSPSPSPPIRPHTSPFFSSHLSQPGQSESTFLGPSHSSLGLWTFMRDIFDRVKRVLLG